MISSSKPSIRASLFVCAYNQERFVADAISAAFDQDYQNLQIILSDDCSQDRTFDIMRDAVASYAGRHEILLRRNETNKGMVPHFFDVAALADGELVVGAAGDDISYPDRVSRLVEVWQATGAESLCSNWDVINECGHLIRRGRPPGRMDLRLNAYFGAEVTPITGATAAYTPAVFRNVLRPAEPVFAEDLFLTLMLHWRRRQVVWVDKPLVAYRVHDTAATHCDVGNRALLDQERLVALQSRRNAAALSVFERLTRTLPRDDGWGAPTELDRNAIAADKAFNDFRSGWLEASSRDRLNAFIRFRELGQRRWLLPRLLGFRGLSLLKHARAGIRNRGARLRNGL